MPRLFTALELPPEVAARLEALQAGLDAARWIDADDFHVTLRFIGDIDLATARDVHEVLGEVRCAPLDVALTELSAFGGAKPRAIVAGVRTTPALAALRSEQNRVLHRVGLPPEPRKWTPHVTLARLRGGGSRDGTGLRTVADYLAANAFLPMPPFSATRFVLMSARDSVGGGPYHVEAAYPLG